MQRYIPVTPDWPQQGVDVVLPAADWQAFTPLPLPSGDARILAFVRDLSARLCALGAAWPDLVALGFWFRPAAVQAHLAAYRECAPLGLSFHLVPSNVPTLAVYSWLMSLLAGNSAIVRLSQRQDPVQQQLLAVCRQVLQQAEHADIAARVRFIRYGHDEAITAHFSARCQLRVVWGGDATVARVRGIALAPLAREIVFADRQSLALIDSTALSALTVAARQQQLAALASDISRFNQQACASPNTLIWVGDMVPAVRAQLIELIAQQFIQTPAWGMSRLVNSQLALACGQATGCDLHAGLSLLQQGEGPRGPVGGGVLYERHYPAIADWLAEGECWQTCVCCGVAPEPVREIVRQYPATRIDRLVRPGQALAFDWSQDGQDLLQMMSRCTR